MLPGKTFTPESVLAIVGRRIWWILVPFAIVSAGTAIYTKRLPDVFSSATLIAVVPPKVPESVIRSTAPRIEERIPAIKNEILSRTRLERIIQDLNLYTEERRAGAIMEDIVERMRGDIYVVPAGGSAIRVGFSGSTPRSVQLVAERLSALFMDESTRDRKLQVENTDQFLEASLNLAEERLVEKEKALEDYRRQHDGELPDQLSSNLQAAQNQEMQIQALVSQTNRDAERRLGLEKAIQDIENASDADLTPTGSPTTQQLAAARTKLADLRMRLTPDHPEVQNMAKTVRDLEKKADTEARETVVSAGSGHGGTPAEAARLNRLNDYRAQLAQLDRSMKSNEAALAATRARASEYLRRADAAPTRQTEMTSLTRDYTMMSQSYQRLLGQKEQSSIATNMERREIGETFRLVDQARLPAKPSSPQRERLNLMGMAAGLALGLGLVGLLEYRDSTFQTDDDLARVLGIPVLAVVPLMQSDQERRRALQRRVAIGTVLGGGVLGCLAVVAYTMVR